MIVEGPSIILPSIPMPSSAAESAGVTRTSVSTSCASPATSCGSAITPTRA
jgi:hypothetical protein